jgi:hypothetical protein
MVMAGVTTISNGAEPDERGIPAQKKIQKWSEQYRKAVDKYRHLVELTSPLGNILAESQARADELQREYEWLDYSLPHQSFVVKRIAAELKALTKDIRDAIDQEYVDAADRWFASIKQCRKQAERIVGEREDDPEFGANTLAQGGLAQGVVDNTSMKEARKPLRKTKMRKGEKVEAILKR